VERQPVKRYFFDVRAGDQFTRDAEGLVLSSQEKAWAEAARSVAELARDQIPKHLNGHQIIIEVRSPEPLLLVSLTFKTELLGSEASALAPERPAMGEIRRLMEAFAAVADPKTKAEILALAERFAGSPLSFESDKTKH
jgi:hypothetical protein